MTTLNVLLYKYGKKAGLNMLYWIHFVLCFGSDEVMIRLKYIGIAQKPPKIYTPGDLLLGVKQKAVTFGVLRMRLFPAKELYNCSGRQCHCSRIIYGWVIECCVLVLQFLHCFYAYL